MKTIIDYPYAGARSTTLWSHPGRKSLSIFIIMRSRHCGSVKMGLVERRVGLEQQPNCEATVTRARLLRARYALGVSH